MIAKPVCPPPRALERSHFQYRESQKDVLARLMGSLPKAPSRRPKYIRSFALKSITSSDASLPGRLRQESYEFKVSLDYRGRDLLSLTIPPQHG